MLTMGSTIQEIVSYQGVNIIVMLINKGKTFYRYDISSEPLPEEWDDTIKSIEYSNTAYGPKNIVGSFFFYDNQETAEAVGRIAIGRTDTTKSIIITSCQLVEDVNLLDLTKYDEALLDVQSDHPLSILNILKAHDIDVLTDNFHRYDTDVVPFSSLMEDFSIVHQPVTNDYNQIKNRINAATRINAFFHDCIPFLGQSLSDFANGISFKDILEKKDYDGYLFLEEPSSPTYCLFKKNKLGKPSHKHY